MKFHTTVFLPPTAPAAALDALTTALAPFDANDYRDEPFDPDAAWDWWQLPRRNLFPLLPDGSTSAFAAAKNAIDFTAIQRETREHAAGTWDAWAALLREHPTPRPRSHFRPLHADPADAEAAWLAQPAVQAVGAAAATEQHPYFTLSFLLADPVEEMTGDRGTYLELAAAEAFATHAYVTLDGRWLSEYTDDRGWTAHIRDMTAYLDAVPADTVIARAWCHI